MGAEPGGDGIGLAADRSEAVETIVWWSTTAAASLALVTTLAVTWLLAWSYSPVDSKWTPVTLKGPVGVLAIGVTTVWAVSNSIIAARRDRSVFLTVAAGAWTVIGSVAAALAWPLVQWQQIALRAVTVGTNMRGLWTPAFSREVKFVLVGGAGGLVEVPQSEFALWVVVAVVAPVLSLAAFIIGAWSSRRTQ